MLLLRNWSCRGTF